MIVQTKLCIALNNSPTKMATVRLSSTVICVQGGVYPPSISSFRHDMKLKFVPRIPLVK